MAKDPGWGLRLREARSAYELRHDLRSALSYAEIGLRVGKHLKRPAFKHSTVRAWFVEGQEPDSFSIVRALAAVLEADPGALIGRQDVEEPAHPKKKAPAKRADAVGRRA